MPVKRVLGGVGERCRESMSAGLRSLTFKPCLAISMLFKAQGIFRMILIPVCVAVFLV